MLTTRIREQEGLRKQLMELVFQNQLDQLFVERAGNARSYDLNETIFERLADSAVAFDRMRQRHAS